MAKEKENEFKPLNDKIEGAMLESRRLFFCDVVDNDTAKDAIRKLWYLEYIQPGKPILFVINSPGGSIDAGFAIWDQAKMITSPIYTLVTGLAASMGSVLSLCGAQNHRYATRFSRIMVHQPRIARVIEGQATDLDIQAKEILKTKQILVELYSKATKKDPAVIDKLLDRDRWMTAQEALDYGLIDKIVTSFAELPL